MQRLGLEGHMRLNLKSLGGAAPLLHRAEASLNAFGELLAGKALNTFHMLLHTTIGPDSETDGVLGHPGSEKDDDDGSGLGQALGTPAYRGNAQLISPSSTRVWRRSSTSGCSSCSRAMRASSRTVDSPS